MFQAKTLVQSANKDRLIAAKRSRFLFLESHYIDKPIQHLKYSTWTQLPDAQDYPFLVPLFSFSHKTRNEINKHTQTPSMAPQSS
ncbi:hypothetical protein RhiirA5_419035 [Rhizophagus irregularis]|uniref:DUF8211 domain-containing protein n=1 Tax=Rhizophagus irregularis TaxID=588596 RepID=A0A2N0PJ20_9GLOM|nr:hypothetical protein RhiirA5_419035 [Rhizophagus irregularis]